jgi:hypothetical protein
MLRCSREFFVVTATLRGVIDEGTLPRLAWRPVTAVSVGLAALLAATANRYDYHRDELYFRMLGDHPAWGYVDQPPATPMIARASIALLGDSLWAIRVVPLLLVVGAVWLAALITREFGGGAGAQSLSALGLVSPFPLIGGHVLSTATPDLLVWAAVTLFAARALLRGQPRWWLAVGAVVGLGLYNKLLVAVLLIGLGAGLVAVGPRRVLGSPWLWAGALVALVIGFPNVYYQVANDFPQAEMAAALAENRGAEARVLLLPMQLILLGVPLVPVWVAGLVALWRRPQWRAVRAFAVAYPVVLVLMLVLSGQFYYVMGLVLFYYAVGCVPVVAWLRTRGRALSMGVAVVLNVVTSAVIALPLLPVGVVGGTFIPDANQVTRDSIGWRVYVRQVAAVVDRLSAGERSRAVIVTSNYGEAGAIARYGPAYDLPAVYSGQNELYRLGPPPESADIAVVVTQGGIARFVESFTSCEPAGRFDNGLGVENEEQEAELWICRGRRIAWHEIWPGVQHYD